VKEEAQVAFLVHLVTVSGQVQQGREGAGGQLKKFKIVAMANNLVNMVTDQMRAVSTMIPRAAAYLSKPATDPEHHFTPLAGIDARGNTSCRSGA